MHEITQITGFKKGGVGRLPPSYCDLYSAFLMLLPLRSPWVKNVLVTVRHCNKFNVVSLGFTFSFRVHEKEQKTGHFIPFSQWCVNVSSHDWFSDRSGLLQFFGSNLSSRTYPCSCHVRVCMNLRTTHRGVEMDNLTKTD